MRAGTGLLRPAGYLIEAVSLLLILSVPDRPLGGGLRLHHAFYAGMAVGAVLVVVNAAWTLARPTAGWRREGRGGRP